VQGEQRLSIKRLWINENKMVAMVCGMAAAK